MPLRASAKLKAVIQRFQPTTKSDLQKNRSSQGNSQRIETALPAQFYQNTATRRFSPQGIPQPGDEPLPASDEGPLTENLEQIKAKIQKLKKSIESCENIKYIANSSVAIYLLTKFAIAPLVGWALLRN